MAENDTSKTISKNTRQENATDSSHKLTLVHQLIEVLVASVALITPLIILFLWASRFAICSFFDLPIFYSSINIIRSVPFFAFAIAIGACIWILYVINVNRKDIISVEVIDNSHKGNEEQARNTEPPREESWSVFEKIRDLFLAVLALFLTIAPHYLLQKEKGLMINGTYPSIIENGGNVEAFLVLVFSIAIIFSTLKYLIKIIIKYIKSGSFLVSKGFYSSRKSDTYIIRTSVLESLKIPLKYVVTFFVFYFLISLYFVISYIAIYYNYFNTSYYLVDFDDVQYAIVLDTDDYYICEPIEITQIDDRELIIHTDSYIYLDKAENPLVVRKESFNSVMILREEQSNTILQKNDENVKEEHESGTEEVGINNTTENAKIE